MRIDKSRLRGISVTIATHTINSGAAGWIDTDCSSDLPANARVALVFMYGAGGGVCGVREHGSSVDTKGNWGAAWTTIPVDVSVTKHIDFYRDVANNNVYKVFGAIY